MLIVFSVQALLIIYKQGNFFGTSCSLFNGYTIMLFFIYQNIFNRKF